MKILAFYNMKGGVGKTTAVVNLAYFAAQDGQRTLLWDLDPQGAATFHCLTDPDAGIKVKHLQSQKQDAERLIRSTSSPHLDIIPANLKMRHIDDVLGDVKHGTKILSKFLQQLAPRYDYAFLDCPAGLSLLVQCVFHVAEYLVMPVIPTTLAFQAFTRIQQYLKKKELASQLPVIPFFSMVDPRKSLHRKTISTYTAAGMFCHTVIPTRSIIEQMGVYRAPLPKFSPNSQATKEYRRLWEEITTRLSESA